MSEDDPGADEATQETPEAGDAAEQPPAEQPTVDWDSDDNPYKQRFSELRPAYDRAHNQLAQLENPESQAEALRRFYGIELEDADELDQPDPDEPVTKAEWSAWLHAQQAQAQAEQQSAQMLDSDTDFAKAELDRLGINEDDPILDALLPLAMNNRDEQGRLGLDAAHKMLDGVLEARHKAYIQSKRAPRVPTGTAGTDKVNLADDDERQAQMAQILAAEEAMQD